MELELARKLVKSEIIPTELGVRLWSLEDNEIRREIASKEVLEEELEDLVISCKETATRYISNPKRSLKVIKKVIKYDLNEMELIQIASQENLNTYLIKKLIPRLTPMGCYTLMGNPNLADKYKAELAPRYVAAFKFRERGGGEEFNRFGDSIETWQAAISASCWFQIGVVRYALERNQEEGIRLAVAEYLKRIEGCQSVLWISYDNSEVVSREDLSREVSNLFSKLCYQSLGDKAVFEIAKTLKIAKESKNEIALRDLKESLKMKLMNCEVLGCINAEHISELELIGEFRELNKKFIKKYYIEYIAHTKIKDEVRERVMMLLRGEDSRVVAKKLINESRWILLAELIKENGKLALYQLDQKLLTRAGYQMSRLGVAIDIDSIKDKEVKRDITLNFRPAKEIIELQGYRETAVELIRDLTEKEKEVYFAFIDKWEGSLNDLLLLSKVTK